MYEFRSFKLQLLYDTSSWNGWEGAEKQNKTKVVEDIRIFGMHSWTLSIY